MIAVDTNVVVRLIVGDDSTQLKRVEKLMADQKLYLSLTVVMETEWVLRSRYGLSRAAISDALTGLCALPAITVERQQWVAWAISRYSERGDFADLVHLVAHADSGLTFMTFDRAVKGNAIGAPIPVEMVA